MTTITVSFQFLCRLSCTNKAYHRARAQTFSCFFLKLEKPRPPFPARERYCCCRYCFLLSYSPFFLVLSGLSFRSATLDVCFFGVGQDGFLRGVLSTRKLPTCQH